MASPAAGKDSSKDTATESGKSGKSSKRNSYDSPGVDVARIRTLVARIVWVVFVLLALVLALAALLIALDANQDNSAVEFVRDLAASVDLGVFDLENPIKGFDGENAETKTALFNYGIGAVVYLIVGRILERIIRP